METERPRLPPSASSGAARVWLRRFGQAALDMVYPAHCPGCGIGTADPGTLCGACWNAVPFITRPYCERLGVPFSLDIGGPLLSPAAIANPPAFDRSRAVALHQGPARDFVHRLKFGDRIDLAKPMGVLMAGAGQEVLEGADVLVPVPLHWTRLFWRRFNQAEALAKVVAEVSGIPVAETILKRVKRTPQQIGLTRSQRAVNLQGAFVVPPERAFQVEGKSLVLIDDVHTTGSTLNACTTVLRRAGAARIDVITFTVVADQAALPI